MKKDPYDTYTNYSFCKPQAHKICWIVPLLVLVVLGLLGLVVYLGAIWYL